MGKSKTALFIMPRSSRDWKGAEGLWITTAGWAAAGKRRYGNSYVLTTDRVAEPSEVVKYPLKSSASSGISPLKKIGSFFPRTFVDFINDILLWRSSKRSSNYNYDIPNADKGVSLVWEQHDLFAGIGYKLAKKFKAPFVIYVHAPAVWEAHKWGIKRPVWGKFIERMEKQSFRRADIVACLSKPVADKLEEMGVPKEKIFISPMAVDPELYINVKCDDIQEEYELNDKFVIGWTGSFRSFHGLDILVKIFEQVRKEIKNAHLLLVGDGIEMDDIKQLVKELDLQNHVSFPGRMSFLRMTKFVNTFDLAILSTRNAGDFHYSPMKLREYLKAGRPILAPNAGEIPLMFRDDVHLQLYQVGDIEGTAEKIIRLYQDPEKRDRLGRDGQEYIFKNGTWDVELDKLLTKMN